MTEKVISYPSRIEASLIKRVNKQRKRDGISWPALTRLMLHHYLAVRKHDTKKIVITE